MNTLSVIIPVYNEEKTISTVLTQVFSEKLPDWKKEIIVVDDASTDRTWPILQETASVQTGNGFRIIRHQVNQGKGAAIRAGLKEAAGELVVIQDADLEYDPQDYYALIRPIIAGKADVVYGSRELGRNRISSAGFFLGGKLLSFLANLLYRARITDEPACYKVFRREILQGLNLRCRRFEFCPEVTAKVRRQGYVIYEVPIHYYPRSIREGKKIRLSDGISAVWTLLRYRFGD